VYESVRGLTALIPAEGAFSVRGSSRRGTE
jgi:hypothetical protein